MSMAEDDDVCSVARQQFFGCRTAELVAVTYVNGKAVDVEAERGLAGPGSPGASVLP